MPFISRKTSFLRLLFVSLLVIIIISCLYISDLSGRFRSCQFESLNRRYVEGTLQDSTQTHQDTQVAFENEISARLEKEVRVLCWVATAPKNHAARAKHVKATWGRRCNKLIFMSTEKDEKLGSVALNVTEGWTYLWGKTKEAFRYIYEKHVDEADWFMKADDDTYVIVENLRYMLSAYKTEDPIWFGSRVTGGGSFNYLSGGAGYVLSKEALRRFVSEGIDDKTKCRKGDTSPEDIEIGRCLQKLGVKVMDTSDYMGRGRFFPLTPRDHFFPGVNGKRKQWYQNHAYHKYQDGINCCSDTAISFHYVSPSEMYELEYFVYHLKPYGVRQIQPSPSPDSPPDQKNTDG